MKLRVEWKHSVIKLVALQTVPSHGDLFFALAVLAESVALIVSIR